MSPKIWLQKYTGFSTVIKISIAIRQPAKINYMTNSNFTWVTNQLTEHDMDKIFHFPPLYIYTDKAIYMSALTYQQKEYTSNMFFLDNNN